MKKWIGIRRLAGLVFGISLVMGFVFGGSVLAASGFQNPDNVGTWNSGNTIWNYNALTYEKVTDANTFTKLGSPYYYNNAALGIAGNFGLVGFNSVTINTDTNDNILTSNLYGSEAGFGTKNISDEVSYVKNAPNTVSRYGRNTDSIFVTGSSTEVSLMDNHNAFGINGTKLDSPKTIYQEQTGGTSFIDVDQVKSDALSLNQTLSQKADTSGVSANFTDQNNQTISVSDASATSVYNLDLTAVQMGSGKTINIKGYDSSSTGCLIINIDMSKATSNTLDNLPAIVLWDGSTAMSNQERTEWNGRVLLNLYNNQGSTDTAFNGTFNVNGRVIASVLAPNATVNLNQNLDGTVIANDITVNAESHRDDFVPSIDTSTGQISVTKVDSENVTTKLPGAVFTIYKDEACTQAAATMTTDESGYALSTALPAGDYYVKETTAPSDYQKNDTVFRVSVTKGTVTSVGTNGYVTDKKAEHNGQISVTKVDAANVETKLSGAEFGIYSDAACTQSVATMTTGSDGTAISKTITSGTYYVKEISAPANYQLNSTVFTVVVTDNSITPVKDGSNEYVTDSQTPETPTTTPSTTTPTVTPSTTVPTTTPSTTVPTATPSTTVPVIVPSTTVPTVTPSTTAPTTTPSTTVPTTTPSTTIPTTTPSTTVPTAPSTTASQPTTVNPTTPYATPSTTTPTTPTVTPSTTTPTVTPSTTTSQPTTVNPTTPYATPSTTTPSTTTATPSATTVTPNSSNTTSTTAVTATTATGSASASTSTGTSNVNTGVAQNNTGMVLAALSLVGAIVITAVYKRRKEG